MQTKSKTSFSSVGTTKQIYPKEIQSALGLNLCLKAKASSRSEIQHADILHVQMLTDLVQFSPENFQLLMLTAMKTLFSTLANSPIMKHLCGEEQNLLVTLCGTSKSWLEDINCCL